MERSKIIISVCSFVGGLIAGCLLATLMPGEETNDTEEIQECGGIVYPQVYGIDVSFWQGNINWAQLSLPCDESGGVSGRIPAPRNQRPVQFAFIRSTKSDAIVDTLYQRNYNEAKQLGIPCGTYHFLTDTVSGKIQAELFLSHARFEPGDLPPVLDVEIDSPDIIPKAKEWLEIVERECGAQAIIYSNMHVYTTRIKDDPVLGTRDLWLAKPRGGMPDVPKCMFWQFTHEGHVWGIIDNVVDINMFNGTWDDLQEYILAKGIKNADET